MLPSKFNRRMEANKQDATSLHLQLGHIRKTFANPSINTGD